jgi:hypothetical protein
VLGAIRATAARPCLAHVAPALKLPTSTSIDKLRDGWSLLGSTLKSATEGLDIKYSKRLLVIPPEILPELPTDAQRRLAPLMCPANDPACDRAASYILRAHEAFDAALHVEETSLYPQIDQGLLHVEIPVRTCDGTSNKDRHPSTFEGWAACVASQAPRNRRYAETRLRAPERGWLVLRGRRGHYQFSDEIRAYDLATGAAYVASDSGALFAADPSAKPGQDTYTGRLAPDQVRELAFVLLTRSAIVELRTGVAYAVIPDALPLVLGRPTPWESWGRSSWASSNQTRIAFTFLDGALRETGEFTWPSAHDWVDNHITSLVRVAEAGLVRGCAPAQLPPLAELGGALGTVSPVDASADALRARHAELDRHLEGLRWRACPGAK